MGFMDEIHCKHKAQTARVNVPATPRAFSVSGTPATGRQHRGTPLTGRPLRGTPSTHVIPAVAFASPVVGTPSIHSMRLRKRTREAELAEPWTPRSKRAHLDYAQTLASDLDLTDEARNEVMVASALSTHNLTLKLYAYLVRDRVMGLAERGQAFLKSREYKAIDHIVANLFGYLMDGDVSGYKEGLLPRCLHHIRLHPRRYHIPVDIEDFITTSDFAKAISRTLGSIRSEMKRKLFKTWREKKGVYDVVRMLLGKSSNVQVTEAMWGRVAWLQLNLMDYQELVKNGEKEQKLFWDWTDGLLVEVRNDHSHLIGRAKAKAISSFFEMTLKEHIRLRPTRRRPTLAALPAWQRQLREAIREMENYTDEDVADLQRNFETVDLEDVDSDQEDEPEAEHEVQPATIGDAHDDA
ncbi:hypothetical protein CONPUDRAFT_160409 [Coniophora puteana RWD-64-598 SS2]|uniref:Uncharacterized protein n=1 Tax=Coniophora puteana (strain RWD-64-598) TaxID=741705 RepID=R7SGF4_CONPW|nr:uncharacterized protein CONPUDRAFT_160409 [Coniophora puteana RWD-64-598 SS2]EIW74159.1 hypothetical protein CONPUDRAFT_160409 [Coniophora puteana RWD-64-598 SS2]